MLDLKRRHLLKATEVRAGPVVIGAVSPGGPRGGDPGKSVLRQGACSQASSTLQSKEIDFCASCLTLQQYLD